MKHLIAASLLLIGCYSDTPNIDKPPIIDQSSPEKTVESVIKYESWNIKTKKSFAHKIDSSFQLYRTMPFLSPLKDSIQAHIFKPEGNRTEPAIDEVKQESETRAVVYLNDYYFSNLENEIINYKEKYVLTKYRGLWFVEEREKVCWRCDGHGKAKELFGDEIEPCTVCKMTGWTKISYSISDY